MRRLNHIIFVGEICCLRYSLSSSTTKSLKSYLLLWWKICNPSLLPFLHVLGYIITYSSHIRFLSFPLFLSVSSLNRRRLRVTGQVCSVFKVNRAIIFFVYKIIICLFVCIDFNQIFRNIFFVFYELKNLLFAQKFVVELKSFVDTWKITHILKNIKKKVLHNKNIFFFF